MPDPIHGAVRIHGCSQIFEMLWSDVEQNGERGDREVVPFAFGFWQCASCLMLLHTSGLASPNISRKRTSMLQLGWT